MFKIFKRRKDKPALTYSVMQYISEAVERRQRKIADYLNLKTKGLSKKIWMLCLCCFCLVFGAVATAILLKGITSKHKKALPIQSISVPAFISRENTAMDSLELMEEIYRHRKDSVFQKKNNH